MILITSQGKYLKKPLQLSNRLSKMEEIEYLQEISEVEDESVLLVKINKGRLVLL
jgi:hypothetical protein